MSVGMVFKDGKLDLTHDEMTDIFKRLQQLDHSITRQSDLFSLKVPVLLALYDVVTISNVTFSEIGEISFPIEDALLGTAILVHFDAISETKG